MITFTKLTCIVLKKGKEKGKKRHMGHDERHA